VHVLEPRAHHRQVAEAVPGWRHGVAPQLTLVALRLSTGNRAVQYPCVTPDTYDVYLQLSSVGCQVVDTGRYTRGYDLCFDDFYIELLIATTGSAGVWTDQGACS
jgi:hypothetical protein